MKLDPGRLPPGFAYFKLIEAIEALKVANKATPDQLKQLQAWVNALPDARKHISTRIDALIA
jgi:hypothetical protein